MQSRTTMNNQDELAKDGDSLGLDIIKFHEIHGMGLATARGCQGLQGTVPVAWSTTCLTSMQRCALADFAILSIAVRRVQGVSGG